MSIFGSLEDVSLADLAPMLSYRVGVLKLFLPQKTKSPIYLYIDRGIVNCVRWGDKVLGPTQARMLIHNILKVNHGSFEFVQEPFHGCEEPLDLSLTHLLLETATIEDNKKAYKDLLPHPDTVFTLVQGAQMPSRVGLQGEEAIPGEPSQKNLQKFYEMAKPLLIRGASARTLSKELDLDLEATRYCLFELKRRGVIRVAPKPAQEEKEKVSLASRLLSLLKLRFG